MDIELEKFFERDDEAFYINENGARKFRGVHRYYNDIVRNGSPRSICPRAFWRERKGRATIPARAALTR